MVKARQRDVQYDTYAQAREAVDQQREFAISQLHSGAAELDLSSASGATVAEVLGFVSAIQLSVHARALRLVQLMAVTASYAALGGLAIIAVIDWGLARCNSPSPNPG